MAELVNDLKIRSLTIALGYILEPNNGIIVEMMYCLGDEEKYGKFVVWKDEDNKKIIVRILVSTEKLFGFDPGQKIIVVKDDETESYYAVKPKINK